MGTFFFSFCRQKRNFPCKQNFFFFLQNDTAYSYFLSLVILLKSINLLFWMVLASNVLNYPWVVWKEQHLSISVAKVGFSPFTRSLSCIIGFWTPLTILSQTISFVLIMFKKLHWDSELCDFFVHTSFIMLVLFLDVISGKCTVGDRYCIHIISLVRVN